MSVFRTASSSHTMQTLFMEDSTASPKLRIVRYKSESYFATGILTSCCWLPIVIRKGLELESAPEERKTMSETLEVLETRRSCRAFKPELIEEEKLQAIIKAGTYAATGMGRQSPIIIAVTNKELRDKLSVMNAKFMGKDESFDPFYGAQELLIVLANKAMPTYLYDGTLVMGNLMNAAADLGVDSCWIHRAKEEFETPEGKEFLKSLGIEGDYEGIGHLVLGYAAAPLKEAAPRKADYVYYVR